MRKPYGYWTKERVFAEARKYQTKTEFFKGCVRGYNVARKKGWLDEISFKEGKRPNGYWTKENVFTEAKKYQTRTKFCRGCSSAYDVAKQNGWLSKMTWFVDVRKSKGYWTKERIFEEARKYQTRCEFQKGCSRAYKVARRNGWLPEMDWFVDGKKKPRKWTKEKVFEETKKYKTRTEFYKSCGSVYNVARKNKWLDELFPKKCAA